MRNYREETEKRVAFIQKQLKESGAAGIVFGNSGGKDSALVGILCKMACENTLGVILPCHSQRNFGMDKDDGEALAQKFGIETRVVDLTAVRAQEIAVLEKVTKLNEAALTNLAPRLRMTTLYAIGAAENRLVAGTGNRSERYMGYFTKWGDGAHDFNPIADLTVKEIYEFLEVLGAPREILEKAPSAGLFEGQTKRKWASPTPRSMNICSPASAAKRTPKSWSVTTAAPSTSAAPSPISPCLKTEVGGAPPKPRQSPF